MDTISAKGQKLALFCVLLGCTPKGRNVEQHDVFFGIAEKLNELTDDMKGFWHNNTVDDLSIAVKKQLPEIDSNALKKELLSSLTQRDKVHIDAWTKVEYADGYKVTIQPKSLFTLPSQQKLYFINLGGYKENEFEEYHKKLFVVATTVNEAFNRVKGDDFMKIYSSQTTGGVGTAHLDDQHKIDFEADDVLCISDVIEGNYVLTLEKIESHPVNEQVIGYVRLNYPD